MTIAQVVEAARHEWVGLSADECLKCNVCNTVCPVARVTDRFPGPKYVGPQAQRFRRDGALPVALDGLGVGESPDVTVDWCSGCGWCTTACPAGVKIAEINNRARARRRSGSRPPLRDWLLGHSDLIGTLGAPVAPLANWALHNRLLRAIGEVTIGVHRRAALPAYAGGTLQGRRRRSGGLTAAPGPNVPGPDRAVVYFHGCAVNYYEPHLAEATIAVLERNGFEVIVPPQACCGLPLISNGLYPAARDQARGNLSTLAAFARAGYRIVGTSTSCTHTLKAEYREMLDVDDDDARAVAEATWDINEFLVDLHEAGRLDTAFGRVAEELPYHAPCQLRSHGIGLPAMDLFALVPGLRATDMDHDCCGIAGTYGLKREKYDVAMAVGAPLFEAIGETDAARVACDSETCRWQIASATGRQARHPVEILAEAYAAADASVARDARGAEARAPKAD
jgi:glycerol-3-phosphate dehydrogenase subunit C